MVYCLNREKQFLVNFLVAMVINSFVCTGGLKQKSGSQEIAHSATRVPFVSLYIYPLKANFVFMHLATLEQPSLRRR